MDMSSGKHVQKAKETNHLCAFVYLDLTCETLTCRSEKKTNLNQDRHLHKTVQSVPPPLLHCWAMREGMVRAFLYPWAYRCGDTDDEVRLEKIAPWNSRWFGIWKGTFVHSLCVLVAVRVTMRFGHNAFWLLRYLCIYVCLFQIYNLNAPE